MTDDDFNDLNPPRISYYPGVVLRVIVENRDHGINTFSTALSGTDTRPSIAGAHGPFPSVAVSIELEEEFTGDIGTGSLSHPGLFTTKDSQEVVEDAYQAALQLAGHSIATSESSVKTHTVLSQRLSDSQEQLFCHGFNEFLEPYFQAMMSGQIVQATDIKESMGEHFGRLQFEIEKSRVIQEQNLQLQRQMQEMQLRILRMQEQTLDRLAIIHNRIQTVITQTYELHEYPIPRLFIILPKERRKRDKLSKPFTKQFRLFFLCECGAHTKVDGSKMSHDIHLAKHDGYDIDRPDDFFEKYGSYVLTMLQMVKYGFIAAGVAVPALSNFKLVEGIDAIQQSIDFSKKTIGAMVDESIKFIQEETSDTNRGIRIATEQADLDKQEVLEGADLRQLESHLAINDKGRVLGNLYRIVTSEGHVKWVCMDHYRDIYQQSAINDLKEIIEANSGSFVEEEGKIEVYFHSRTLVKQFYEAMVKARCIQELTISLYWDVTGDDLQTFATAVTKANVVKLDLRGCSAWGQMEGIESTLFEPVWQLMSNGRIQSMSFDVDNKQLLRVNVSEMKTASKLRVLSFSGLQVIADGRLMLTKILEQCPALNELSMKDGYAHDVFQYVHSNASRFRNLRMLTVEESRYSASVGLSQGNIEAIDANLLFSSCWEGKGMQEFFLGGLLTKVKLDLQGDQTTRDQYAAILQCNSTLSEVIALCDRKQYLDVVEWTMSEKRDFIVKDQPTALHKLEVRSDTEGANVSCTLKYENGSPVFNMSTTVKLKSVCQNQGDLPRLFHQYGWSITELDTTDCLGFRNNLNNLALLLDDSTALTSSKLVSLKLNLTTLSPDGLDCVDRIIARSQSLQDLSFILHMDGTRWQKEIEWQQKIEWLFGRQGKRLNGLALYGHGGISWNPEAARLLPSRAELPKLDKFEVYNVDTRKTAQSFALWIADMISAPSTPQQVMFMSPQLSPNTYTPLKRISIDGILFSEEHWNIVFSAIDFTALEDLVFHRTNFYGNELLAFLGCIPEPKNSEMVMPLKTLYFDLNDRYRNSMDGLEVLVAKLKEKAPLVEIEGLQ
ncbi:hypothetical protein BGZ58_008059 [Dissophora ornata]|nr:hypothetical protein BGZ58_008059 [Dissophora ornata]